MKFTFKTYRFVWLRTILALCFILINSSSFGQKTVKINIEVVLNHHSVNLNDTVILSNGEKIIFKTLKFYLSNFTLLNEQNKIVFTEAQSHHLIDLSDSVTSHIKLNLSDNLTFNTISFGLGIDSLVNVSGAMPGDLDPTKGMYWTWNSGYVNFKTEGSFIYSNNVQQVFEYHLGGYLSPFYSYRSIKLNIINPQYIHLIFDINSLFCEMSHKKTFKVLSPGKEAASMSDYLSKCFNTQ